MHILQAATGSSLHSGPRRFRYELLSAADSAAFKDILNRGYGRIKIGMVVNNSDHSVYAKSETDGHVLEVPAHSVVVAPFDGVATWNPEQGKVLKCTDFSVGYVQPDGRVACDEPGFPSIDHVTLLNTPPDPKWNEIFDVAKSLHAQPLGGGGVGSTPPHDHEHGPSNHTYLGDFNTSPGVGDIA